MEKKLKEIKQKLSQKKIEYYNINEKINTIVKEIEEEKIKIEALSNIEFYEHKLKTKENEENEKEKETNKNKRLFKKEGTSKEIIPSNHIVNLNQSTRRGSMLIFKDENTKQRKRSSQQEKRRERDSNPR